MDLVFKWRRHYKRGAFSTESGEEASLLPVDLVPAAPAESACREGPSGREVCAYRRRTYTVEFKRRIVELALRPGASVARIARTHQLNDNLVFKWRDQYRRGTFRAVSGDEASLLPVKLIASEAPAQFDGREAVPGKMELWIGRARLSIQGGVDAQTLQTVLRCLVR